MTAQSTVIHSRTKRTALRSGAVTALVVGAVLLDLEWIAQRPSRELRSADALLAEAYSKQRGFELRLPGASYAPIVSQQEKGERSAFSRPVVLLEATHTSQRKPRDDGERARAHRLYGCRAGGGKAEIGRC